MRRYLFDGRLSGETLSFDTLVVGSGIAGLYAALHLDEKLSCAVLTKEGFDISNSWLAQGGIAAAINKDDRPQFHLEDTLVAGAGLCDEKAVRILVDEGPKDIENLVALHVPFDLNEEGDLQTGREGGHRLNRIVHAQGDATGRETVKTLAAIAATKPNISFLQNTFLIDIITDDHGIVGAIVEREGEIHTILAPNIIISTGGIGQIYLHSTNPSVATGDGLAAAYRGGAALKHMEFIQFHPTGLYCDQEESRSFLISEALRGEGAVLRNTKGERFMVGQHPMAELAPRDIVARGITREMLKNGTHYVSLDITDKTAEQLKTRFPTIYQECLKRGYDISQDYIPVCPVQHYIMGGIATDTDAMSTIPGLYACGEAACTGVHGANRLASNSMLECLVFGRRAAQHISKSERQQAKHVPPYETATNKPERAQALNVKELRKEIRAIMSKDGWVIRRGDDMKKALSRILAIREELEHGQLTTKEAMEALNMATVSQEILGAAVKREKSLGAHYREDDKLHE